MPLSDPAARRLAGRVGAAQRNGRDATELRRDLAEARLADAIRKIVDTAPPLTSAQVDRLRGLLRPGAAATDGAA